MRVKSSGYGIRVRVRLSIALGSDCRVDHFVQGLLMPLLSSPPPDENERICVRVRVVVRGKGQRGWL